MKRLVTKCLSPTGQNSLLNFFSHVQIRPLLNPSSHGFVQKDGIRSSDVSEKHTVSIFRIEEYAQKTSMKRELLNRSGKPNGHYFLTVSFSPNFGRCGKKSNFLVPNTKQTKLSEVSNMKLFNRLVYKCIREVHDLTLGQDTNYHDRFFVVFLNLSRDSILIMPRPFPSKFFLFISHPTIRRYILTAQNDIKPTNYIATCYVQYALNHHVASCGTKKEINLVI
jgi:hypothetical protein